MHVTQWKEPALTWNGSVPDEGPAAILEIRSDQFIPDFLQAMGTRNPASYFNKHRIDDDTPTSDPLKLYQPLHGCFYLITASLVCRQLGLPDKRVSRANGESVFYVIRRQSGSSEEAWIPNETGGSWKLLAGDKKYTLAEGEERLPMHPVKICPNPAVPQSILTDNVERDLFYGYIPTGNRDKYKDTVARTIPAGVDPAVFANEFINAAEVEYNSKGYDFRQDIFYRRVYLPWASLGKNLQAGTPVTLRAEFATTAQIEQLYIILELGAYIQNNLPTLWTALLAGSAPAGNLKDLYDDLTINLEVKVNGTNTKLWDVIDDYKGYFSLLRGQGNIPNTKFDFTGFDTNTANANSDLRQLKDSAYKAVDAEPQPFKVPGGESSELVNLIKNQVQPKLPAGKEPVYHIRTVYEYDPDCPPVVSMKATRPFYLTKFFDPDAPARLVRLEAPSIKPKDLRKYARGVGIEMSPELHKLASCLGGDDVQGVIDGVESCDNSGGGGLSIQMICSFSVQIIFLVAFIVMFIFLISLNFIFGWLAYLRICLPIPTKSN